MLLYIVFSFHMVYLLIPRTHIVPCGVLSQLFAVALLHAALLHRSAVGSAGAVQLDWLHPPHPASRVSEPRAQVGAMQSAAARLHM